MSKADTLLKKATFFERMALYSDRKAFLHAIAQEQQAQQPDPNRNVIWQALQIMQQAGVDEATSAPLGNAVTFGKTDIPAIQRAINNAIYTKMSPLSQQAQIDQLRQLSQQLHAPMTEAEQGMAGPADVTFPAAHIRGFAPISRADQKAVFDFATKGVGQIDGQLGKETRAALEKIKNYFAGVNPNNPRMTDQQAIQAARSPVNAGKPLP